MYTVILDVLFLNVFNYLLFSNRISQMITHDIFLYLKLIVCIDVVYCLNYK